jgi:CRP/FNR family transcriptional regulator, anaerobic regulatory protein
MDADELLQLLSATHELPSDFIEGLAVVLKPVQFPKGHYLVQAHTPANHIYFLEKGFAVGFVYDRNDRIVIDFWKEGQIIVSPRSFFSQQPGNEIIEVASRCELLALSYPSFKSLTKDFSIAGYLALDIMAAYHGRREEGLLDLHRLDTWARYQKLLTEYPRIEQSVSQELIASYLNVTPQSLSRLKAKRH